MAQRTDMMKIMEDELRKVRRYPHLRFHGFAYTNEVDAVRARLKAAGVGFKTRPVQRDGQIVGYNVYTEE